MTLLRRWLLILFTLVLGGGHIFAADSREDRAYAVALSAFRDTMYDRAETEFAQFVQKYRKSARVPEVLLLQAQAEFKQGKFTQAIELLSNTNNMARAGTLADQYVYWIGEAQFASSNYTAAADTFVSLSRNFRESPLRLAAVVVAASAHAQVHEWPQLIALLRETNGVFQRAEQLDPGNEHVSDGRLLLARALSARNDFAGSDAVLASINPQTLRPEQDWQRMCQLYRNKLAADDLGAALEVTTNLVQIAQKNADRSADAWAMRGKLLEKLDRLPEAIAAYGTNMAPSTPIEKQQQAILKIAELAVAQKQFTNAEPALEKFLAKFPGSPLSDIALLTLGELHLKDYLASGLAEAETNQLQQALASFDRFIGSFTNSALLGKAHLDRGWALWLAGKTNAPETFDAFQAATKLLPASEDLAVAWFKMGDVLLAQTNYTGALTNYHVVITGFTNLPAVVGAIADLALYQSLCAHLELKDARGASNTMVQILKLHPSSDVVDSGLLLIGEGWADSRRPAVARAMYEKFVGQSPTNVLRPQVELAIARTYELEGDWGTAIRKYTRWLGDFPAHVLLPRVNYALAWANFQAGNETNAFGLFTNFVAQFPTNDLAPQAQWWVADHFFRAGEFVDAEKNYQLLFQKWPASKLVYEARMMAGRAAVAHLGYLDAIRDYFTKLELEEDTNCPMELRLQATFAHGSALMHMDSADTNKPLANIQTAVKVFDQICQVGPTNENGMLALGEIGNCYLQLTNYDAATNAYAKVVSSAFVNVAVRSQAQIGLGIALEKKAALAAGEEQNKLLLQARDNYLGVFYGDNLRKDRDELQDPFWTKKAGLQALPLVEALGVSDPDAFIDRMEKWFPQSVDSLEKKRTVLPPAKK